MPVNHQAIKALRAKTSASISDCREALESAAGDETQAMAYLRKRGADIGSARQGRTTAQGRVETYVHHDGRLAAIVEVDCETDFVARTPDFLQFCKDVSLQVAAMDPRYVETHDAPEDIRSTPDAVKTAVLLEQPFVKDQSMTIHDLLNTLVSKTGEKVVIRRFMRFLVGDTSAA